MYAGPSSYTTPRRVFHLFITEGQSGVSDHARPVHKTTHLLPDNPSVAKNDAVAPSTDYDYGQ